ncbi:hypothetical protein AGIG_G8980 [Arapaima gigas]
MWRKEPRPGSAGYINTENRLSALPSSDFHPFERLMEELRSFRLFNSCVPRFPNIDDFPPLAGRWYY